MKKTNILLLCAVTTLLASCSTLYQPALYHQDIAYQPKPVSFDTVKSATYISAAYEANLSTDYSDLIQSGQFNISRGHVFDGFNIAYGAFGSLGDYEHDGTTGGNNFGYKNFGALGARASANLFTNNDDTEFRFIGMEMAYSHEFGDYADLRKNLYAQGGYYIDPRTDLFTVGLTSEVIFKDRRNPFIQHGFRLFLGTTLGNNPLDQSLYAGDIAPEKLLHYIFPKISYYIKFKKFFGTFEGGNQFFVRFGYAF